MDLTLAEFRHENNTHIIKNDKARRLESDSTILRKIGIVLAVGRLVMDKWRTNIRRLDVECCADCEDLNRKHEKRSDARTTSNGRQRRF